MTDTLQVLSSGHSLTIKTPFQLCQMNTRYSKVPGRLFTGGGRHVTKHRRDVVCLILGILKSTFSETLLVEQLRWGEELWSGTDGERVCPVLSFCKRGFESVDTRRPRSKPTVTTRKRRLWLKDRTSTELIMYMS